MVKNSKYNTYKYHNMALSPIQQIIMLYEGAVLFLKKAKDAIDKHDHEAIYNYLENTKAIITGLLTCLDHKNAKEMSKILSDFYIMINMQLNKISFNNNNEQNKATCDVVINCLQKMTLSWRDVSQQMSSLDKTDLEVNSQKNIESFTNGGINI